MHNQFRRNLAKMMVFAIVIPSVYTNASVSHDTDEIIYINNNIETTTGPAIEIKPSESLGDLEENDVVEDSTTGVEIAPEVVPPVSVLEPNETVEHAMTIASASAWDGSNMIEPQLQGSIYTITCANELAWIEDQVNSGALDGAGITIQLQNDIDLNSHSVVIGNETYSFKGNFDGQGYTISNLSFNDRLAQKLKYVGLFGHVDGGVITNVNLDVIERYMANDSYTTPYYGCLIGYGENLSELKDIKVHQQIEATDKGRTIIGGVAGYISTTTNFEIRNVDVELFFEKMTNYSQYKLGGIIGDFKTTRDTIEILLENSKVKISGEAELIFPGAVSGVILNMDTPNMKNGSFIINNVEVGLYTDGLTSFGALTGISNSLKNFNQVSVTDYVFDLGVVAKSTNNNPKSALFGNVTIDTGISGYMNFENCSITGYIKNLPLTGFIYQLEGKDIDVTFKNCARNMSTAVSSPQDNSSGSLIAVAKVNNMKVTDCRNASILTSRSCTGGFFGELNCTNLTMENCVNTGDIVGESYNGGLIGSLECATEFNILNCANHGNFSGQSPAGVGGLIGYSSRNDCIKTIDNCANYGDLGSVRSFAGGLIGQSTGRDGANVPIKISNSKNLGSMREASGYNMSSAGGLIGDTSGKADITNCYVECEIISSGAVGGLVGRLNWRTDGPNENALRVTGCYVNLKQTTASLFGGLIGRLNFYGGTPLGDILIDNNLIENINASTKGVSGGMFGEIYQGVNLKVTNNTLKDINIATTSSSGVAGVIGTLSGVESSEIGNNSFVGINVETNSAQNSFLVGNFYSGVTSGKMVVKNNLMKGNIISNVENADLVGYATTFIDFGGNIVIISGKNLKNGVKTVTRPGETITQSSQNYYVSDIRDSVSDKLFTPITTEELKHIGTFQGLNFDDVWGYTDDNLAHPVLIPQSYSISSNEQAIELLMGSTAQTNFEVSHPSLLSSVEVVIEDDEVATIMNGEIVPLKAGVTKVTYRTNGAPLTEQLKYSQVVTVGDYTPILMLKGLIINQGETIPSTEQFVESFIIEHPFDNTLNDDVTNSATYNVLEIKDSHGTEIVDLDTNCTGEYTISLDAVWGKYTEVKEVPLTIKKVIDDIMYDNSILEVVYGTELTDTMLPTSIEVFFKDGTSIIQSIPNWDITDYNPSQAGEYIISATVTLPDNLLFNGSNEVVLTKPIKVQSKKEKPSRPIEEIDDKEWIIPETTVTEVAEERVTVSFEIDKDRWYVNGQLMSHVMDKKPEIIENRAYIPLRFLSYALQVNEDNIKWDNMSKMVEITDGENKITLTTDSRIAILNGQSFEMDAVPFLSKGRLMLPISQIQGVFKNRQPIVEWDQEDKRVDITLTLLNYKG